MFDPLRPVLRERLQRGEAFDLFWFALGSVPALELAARHRPGGIVIDLQHGIWDRSTLEAALGRVPAGIPAIVRVAENSAAAIGQALDAGAEGVMVPLVESGAEARLAASATRYPPQGTRSGGGVRPLADFRNYLASANRNLIACVMIETARGVENARVIAATPGIDAVFIGTGDLALSLGVAPGDARHEEACRFILDACDAAGTPCGIFTPDAEAASRRIRQGFRFAVSANDIDVVASGFAGAQAGFNPQHLASALSLPPAPAVKHKISKEERKMAQKILDKLASALAGGSIRVVDLTQTLRPSTPVIQLPPDFSPTAPFSISEISRYDQRGPAWYWNNIACGEHTGTHFDAPVHWISGRHLKDGATDTVNPQRMVAPACVIDVAKECARDEKFLVEPKHILAWEKKHGRIPKGSWVLMRSDWSKRTDPKLFLNMKEDGPHVPGPSAAAVRLLVEERDVNGWGVESVGTDAGQAFAFEPPFPAHALMHGANKFGLASLANLDQLPPTGALIITPPLKIENGSGSPLRVLALVVG